MQDMDKTERPSSLADRLRPIRGEYGDLPLQGIEIVGLVLLACSILTVILQNLKGYVPPPATPAGRIINIALQLAVLAAVVRMAFKVVSGRANLILLAIPMAVVVLLACVGPQVAKAGEELVAYANADPTSAAVVATCVVVGVWFFRAFESTFVFADERPFWAKGAAQESELPMPIESNTGPDDGQWPEQLAHCPHRYFVAYRLYGRGTITDGWIAIARTHPISSAFDIQQLQALIKAECLADSSSSQPHEFRVLIRDWRRFEAPASPPGARDDIPEPVVPENVLVFQGRKAA